ncbi:hypothetical protein SRHO_G00277730 [Serrasalmus rhombeus]
MYDESGGFFHVEQEFLGKIMMGQLLTTIQVGAGVEEQTHIKGEETHKPQELPETHSSWRKKEQKESTPEGVKDIQVTTGGALVGKQTSGWRLWEGRN